MARGVVEEAFRLYLRHGIVPCLYLYAANQALKPQVDRHDVFGQICEFVPVADLLKDFALLGVGERVKSGDRACQVQLASLAQRPRQQVRACRPVGH